MLNVASIPTPNPDIGSLWSRNGVLLYLHEISSGYQLTQLRTGHAVRVGTSKTALVDGCTRVRTPVTVENKAEA
jgi:hypothetical protein